MRKLVGRHVSSTGGASFVLESAAALGCTTIQVFASNPRTWKVRRAPNSEAGAYAKASKTSSVNPVFAHMAYLANLASPVNETYEKSIKCLEETLLLCNKLGIPYLVMHLGSSMGSEKPAAIKRVAEGLSKAISKSDGSTTILPENQAGHKNSIGAELEDLAILADQVKNLSFCLDTCHLFAAGYDITKHKVLDEIDSLIGFRNVKCIHLNDAAYELGSHKDRHANIGFGSIAKAGFSKMLAYDKLSRLPLILETPISNKITIEEEIKLAKSLMA